MRTVPLQLISPFDNRELTITLVRRATGLGPTPAHNIVLTLDAVSAGVLRAAGITGHEGLPMLGALWRHPPRLAEPRRQIAVAPGEREQPFLTDLGQRVHVLRHVRRLTSTGVQNRTALPAAVLHVLQPGGPEQVLEPGRLRLSGATDESRAHAKVCRDRGSLYPDNCSTAVYYTR